MKSSTSELGLKRSKKLTVVGVKVNQSESRILEYLSFTLLDVTYSSSWTRIKSP